MNSMTGGIDGRHNYPRYLELLTEANRRLDGALAAIRQEQDAGEMAIREAADARIAVLGIHLDALKLLRSEFLPD